MEGIAASPKTLKVVDEAASRTVLAAAP